MRLISRWAMTPPGRRTSPHEVPDPEREPVMRAARVFCGRDGRVDLPGRRCGHGTSAQGAGAGLVRRAPQRDRGRPPLSTSTSPTPAGSVNGWLPRGSSTVASRPPTVPRTPTGRLVHRDGALPVGSASALLPHRRPPLLTYGLAAILGFIGIDLILHTRRRSRARTDLRSTAGRGRDHERSSTEAMRPHPRRGQAEDRPTRRSRPRRPPWPRDRTRPIQI